jgi:hypothetical protein
VNTYTFITGRVQDNLSFPVKIFDLPIVVDGFDPDQVFADYIKDDLVGEEEKKKFYSIQVNHVEEKTEYTNSQIVKKYEQQVYPSRASPLKIYNSFYTHISLNQSNSCFIDASFELLWNAVMSLIDLNSSLLHDHAKKFNKYDQVLIDSFKLYSEENVEGTEKASTIAREFVWNLKNYNGITFLFSRGSMHNCLEVFEQILENLSAELISLILGFSLPSESDEFCGSSRVTVCSKDKEHRPYEMLETPVVVWLNLKIRYELILCDDNKIICYKDEPELEEDINFNI